MRDIDPIASALRTIELETAAVRALATRIDANFVTACQLILACRGRAIVTGMGKSGHIANKIAATLASTGTPSFFVHPGEASHGDLGMITRDDLVIALSNSGETTEVTTLIPLLKRLGVPLIALTGAPDSLLARTADVHLDVSVAQEACPLGLAPTTSTTAALVMGDALAVALLEKRGFSAEDFAFSHPGGKLGRRLLLKVGDVMHGGPEFPRVTEATPLRDALLEMTQKGFGLTAVVTVEGELLGVFTDGDLRRAIDHRIDINVARVGEVMTRNCKTVSSEMLAAEALTVMEDNKITALVVTDARRPAGVVHMHDLLRAGVV
ncbi:MAG: KpsF/GutQ family sugar-phosphate isomerase [Gammaproteobacteria bacterium]|jgi:arabinose-5-phosphate isomerase